MLTVSGGFLEGEKVPSARCHPSLYLPHDHVMNLEIQQTFQQAVSLPRLPHIAGV